MENFWEAVNLMFFIYALAAVVSLVVAWSIKVVFAVFRTKNDSAEEKKPAAEAAP